MELSLDSPVQICIVGEGNKNPALLQKAKCFGFPVVSSDTGQDLLGNQSNVFIICEFEGPIFDELKSSGRSVLGPPVVEELAALECSLPNNKHPLYCLSMDNVVTCFNGYSDKLEVKKLMALIRYMGGSTRKDMGRSVTHLIAKSSIGMKYSYAVVYGIPIMSDEWISKSWEKRNEINFKANCEEMMMYKLKPFSGVHMCFSGFVPEDEDHMKEILTAYGGTHTEMADSRCTHMVVNELNVAALPDVIPDYMHKITSKWFWTSVQQNIMAVEDVFSITHLHTTPERTQAVSTFSHQQNELSEAKEHPAVENIAFSIQHCNVDENVKEPPPEEFSNQRRNVFLELYQTENNYVAILDTILMLRDQALDTSQPGGALLSLAESKIMFSNLSSIRDMHKMILKELLAVSEQWDDDVRIGDIFFKFCPQIKRIYPPFVNFFEKSKEMVKECDSKKPRFHAFLQVCKVNPLCHRQSLIELLIRPIQRIPSIILLLKELLKYTEASNPDYSSLETCIHMMCEIVALINEDKRKTENLFQIFDIFNLIESCPACIISSYRQLVVQFKAIELSNELCGRGYNLKLFLFTDIIQICKIKNKGLLLSKHPTSNEQPLNHGKIYRHLVIISLSDVVTVIDVKDSPHVQNAIGFSVQKCDGTLGVITYIFHLISGTNDKIILLNELSKHVARMTSRPSTTDVVVMRCADEVGIKLADPLIPLSKFVRGFSSCKNLFKLGIEQLSSKPYTKKASSCSNLLLPLGTRESGQSSLEEKKRLSASSENVLNSGESPCTLPKD